MKEKISGKMSFSSLSFHKNLFFVPKLLKVCFSSLNFVKCSTLRPSVYVR